MIWKSRFDLWYERKRKNPLREVFWCLVEAPSSDEAIKAAQAFAEHSSRMDMKLLSVEHRQTGSVIFPCKLPLAGE